jgi:GNAT superfamily N-acetyltransferase
VELGMKASIHRTSQITRTARVMQVAGLFDLPLDQKISIDLDVSVPIEDKPWNVGLIVGPSGAAKSLLAGELWPHVLVRQAWDDRAVVDHFPAAMGTRDVTGLLTAVGLGSPPAWVRPYATLSNGEQFRASMARALAETSQEEIVVVDEFTSVVDRQVAKVASHTVQKTVRKAGRQFVAVTCHYDVIDWLQPDWVLEMPTAELTWRQVQPHPPIQLDIHRVSRTAWPLFEQHHYLNPKLHPAATCWCGYVEGRPVVFESVIHFPHPRTNNIRMGHRLVVLPDWQGLGIASRVLDWVGLELYGQGLRFRSVAAHPAMIAYLAGSPRWRDTTRSSAGGVHTGPGRSAVRGGMAKRAMDARSLGTRSFEYVPPKGTLDPRARPEGAT